MRRPHLTELLPPKLESQLIPACASRLVSRRFPHSVLLASGLGAGCAVVGLLLSALLDLPSGPAVVVVQLAGFLAALALAPRGQGIGA